MNTWNSLINIQNTHSNTKSKKWLYEFFSRGLFRVSMQTLSAAFTAHSTRRYAHGIPTSDNIPLSGHYWNSHNFLDHLSTRNRNNTVVKNIIQTVLFEFVDEIMYIDRITVYCLRRNNLCNLCVNIYKILKIGIIFLRFSQYIVYLRFKV
jgi:hypothetical protein